jgi:hypothetical protein
MNGVPSIVLSWNVFSASSEPSTIRSHFHNAYFRDHFDTHKVLLGTYDFSLFPVILSLTIMNGDFRPLFCPWNVLASQSSSTIRSHSQINAYSETTLTRIKVLLGKNDFSFIS